MTVGLGRVGDFFIGGERGEGVGLHGCCFLDIDRGLGDLCILFEKVVYSIFCFFGSIDVGKSEREAKGKRGLETHSSTFPILFSLRPDL